MSRYTAAQRSFINSAIALSQREVISLVVQGQVPQSVPDFATLHDYVDANELGGLCDGVPLPMFPQGASAACEIFTSAVSHIQDAVDEWLKCGVLAGLRHDYMVLVHIALEEDEEEREYLAKHPQRQVPGYGLNEQERATVLAALRIMQNGTRADATTPYIPMYVRDFFSEVDVMTNGEIDSLCERINLRLDGSTPDLTPAELDGMIANGKLNTVTP